MIALTTMTLATAVDPEFWREVAANWGTGGGGKPLFGLLAAVGVLLSLLATLKIGRMLEQREAGDSPAWLFRSVAREAGLNWRQRWLLHRIARQRKLESPITLVCAAGAFRHHTDAYLQALPRARRRRAAAMLDHVRRIIFPTRPSGGPPPSSAAPSR